MIARLAKTLALALLFGLPLPAAAQEDVAPDPEPVATPQTSTGGFWQPPSPSAEAYDWIRLKSGEWLKGEIKRMRDESMHFDSDELDDLDIDWKDITALRSPRLHTYVLEGRRVHTGTATMSEGRIVIATADGVLEFSRDGIVGIVSGDQSELNWWSGKLSAGLTARSGNTNSTDVTAQFSVIRETAITRLNLGYNGATSTQNDVQTADNHRVNASFDVYVSRRFFLTAPSFTWYRDKFQNIDHQLTSGVGLGYDLIKRKKIDWEIGLGAAHQYTQFISVSQDAGTAQDAAVTFTTDLDLELTKDLDWDTDYNLSLVVTNLGLTSHHLLSTFSFDVWGPLDLDVSFTWDRVEQPVPADDGSVPESNDYRLSVGIGIEF